MKKFKKFLTVVLTLAMVVGLFGVQSAMKAKAADELTVTAAELAPTPNAHIQLTVKDGETPVESGITWKVEGKRDNSTTVADGGMLAIGSNEVAGTVLSITAEIGDEGSKKTGTLNLTVVAMAGEAYDFTVWVNGKDIKANAAKNIKAALYKTSASIEHITRYSGGKWNILVTDTSVTDAAALIKLIDKKGKADKNATAVKNGAELAKAKMKDGVITVTSNKKAGKFYVWVYETKKVGKDVVVINDANKKKIEPVKYTGISKMANKGLVLSDKVNAQGFTTDKSLAKLDTLPAKEITLYILNKGDAAADKDCTYSVTVPEGQTKVKAVVNNATKTVAITVAKDAGSDKGTAYKLTITNDQSQQKATFTLTVKNPTIAGEKEITIAKSNVEETYKVMTGKTEVKDAVLSMKEQNVTGVTFADNKLTVAPTAQAGTVTIELKAGSDVIASFTVTIKAAPAETPAK